MIHKDHLLFGLYIVMLVVLTSVHRPLFITAALLLLCAVAAYTDLLTLLLKRTFKSIWAALAVISLSYLAMGLFKPIDPAFLLLLNLRVFTLTMMTFLMLEHVNLFRVLSFSKKLTSLVTLSFSQIHIFRRTFVEFQLGYASRTARPGWRSYLKALRAILVYFVNKTLHTSQEISLGMKSRGFFHD